MTLKLRPTLVLWHRWFGLFAALWLILMAVTGSIIVFYNEADTALNPHLRRVTPKGEMVSASRIVKAAEAYAPGTFVTLINMPEEADRSAWVFIKARKGSGAQVAGGTYLLIDPYSAEVLGKRVFGASRLDRQHLMDMIYQLHVDLLLGEWMVIFLGVVAFLWFLDHVAALILSFPVAAKWAQSFMVRRNARGHKLVFDLHRAGGLWFFPVTLMLAFSGVYLNLYTPVIAVVDMVSPVTHRYSFEAPYLDAPVYDPPVSYSEATRKAKERAGKPVDLIRFFPWKGIYVARAFDDRDIDPYGRRMIAIDAESGVILDDFHASSGTAGDQFLAWQYPLHSGKAFGWPGRLIIFLSGLMVTGFSVTGILIWWRKRKARVARA